jgi:hypothetical protein
MKAEVKGKRSKVKGQRTTILFLSSLAEWPFRFEDEDKDEFPFPILVLRFHL